MIQGEQSSSANGPRFRRKLTPIMVTLDASAPPRRSGLSPKAGLWPDGFLSVVLATLLEWFALAVENSFS